MQHSFRLVSFTMIGLITLLSGLWGCAGLHRPDPPRIDMVGLNLVGADLFEQRYALRLRLQNTNDTAITIRGMDYEVYVNDHPFAHGISREAITIPAFGEEVVELKASSNFIGFFTRLIKQAEKLDQGLQYRLKGGIKVAGWPRKIPFQHSGELTPGKK